MAGTALIVEDHPEQAELVARILGMRAYRVDRRRGWRDRLADGPRAPSRRRAAGPDAARHQRLRRLPAAANRPRDHADSGGHAHGAQRRAAPVHGFRVGANAYVTKPYGVDDLFEAITAACAWRRSIANRALQGEIHVELNSEINFLQDLNDFSMLVCQSTPLGNDQVVQLRQAVMEMAQNAIEWGNLHQSDRLVNITYRVHDDRLEIVVCDQGPGFDRTTLPHAAVAGDPFTHLDVREKLGLRAGGFGLLICQGMVDEMRYNDQGNEVTLIKRFSPSRPLRQDGRYTSSTGTDGHDESR